MWQSYMNSGRIFTSRDTLLGGIAAQIKLDDGSHVDVVDDTDLTAFNCHRVV